MHFLGEEVDSYLQNFQTIFKNYCREEGSRHRLGSRTCGIGDVGLDPQVILGWWFVFIAFCAIVISYLRYVLSSNGKQ
jgi:hypothetical protein